MSQASGSPQGHVPWKLDGSPGHPAPLGGALVPVPLWSSPGCAGAAPAPAHPGSARMQRLVITTCHGLMPVSRGACPRMPACHELVSNHWDYLKSKGCGSLIFDTIHILRLFLCSSWPVPGQIPAAFSVVSTFRVFYSAGLIIVSGSGFSCSLFDVFAHENSLSCFCG